MNDVKWIKLKVGMFDGKSFKRIKKAKIGGTPFRDTLTAVWFELLDLGAKHNNNGILVACNEIAFNCVEDIAIMLDRDEDEIQLCLDFYLVNDMVEMIDNVYRLANWGKYQNVDGLEKMRENARLRQQKKRLKDKQLLLEKTEEIEEKEQEKEEMSQKCHVTSRNFALISYIFNLNNTLYNNNTYLKYIKDNINNLNKEDNNIYNVIIKYLNNVCGTRYTLTNKKTISLINARLKEKFMLEDFIVVINTKYDEWKNSEMEKYLRPETLFGTKFESYLNQSGLARVENNNKKSIKDNDVMEINGVTYE